VEAVQKKPALKVEAPDGVLASVWQKGSKRIVHLVNYRGQPVRNVKVVVPDAKAAKVQLLSPEGEMTAADVEMVTGSAAGQPPVARGVRFTVPQVGVYTVAVVG
jgi:hypothetical protein